ncbi:MAG TPA: EAL domain-containing protein [Acidobacteriaceae bacterium]|nr:EAL domain-containing protein [Acidobacteriaceae bacterium]
MAPAIRAQLSPPLPGYETEDRSLFICDVAVNADDAAITTAIISMARGLNLRVLAVGVETETQLDFLREHGCDEYQVYYFSRPMTVDNITKGLGAWPTSLSLTHAG